MIAALGADCELHDAYFVGQDVNGWSSLAHVVVGVAIGAAVLGRRVPRTFGALAVLTAIEGIGSLLLHGTTGEAAQLLHDVPLLGMVGFLAGWHVGRLVDTASTSRGASRGALAGAVVGLAAGAVASPTGWTSVAAGAAVAAIVAGELVARRRRLVPVWSAAPVALVVFGGVAWAAGSSDSPLCDEESLLQLHAAWHLLSALVLLVWVDRATAAQRPEHPPRILRRAVDRLLGLLTIGLSRAFFRTVDIAGRDRLPDDRLVLIVANHGNGFVDPIVVTAVLGRLPRFLAKAALWKVAVARPFLALAGVLPVHRRADGDRAAANRSIFEACHRELGQGATVAIFPEGTTGDRAGLDRVKSGAARIALGAVHVAPGLAIVPVGLAFESRIETRGRAMVMVGEPISPVARRGTASEPDHDEVVALTDDITAALEAVSPEFQSVEERETLRAAARVALLAESPDRLPAFGRVEELARRMAAAPVTARQAVLDAFGRYATQLQLIGVTDRQLGPSTTSWARVAASTAVLVVLGSVVVTATLIHLPALMLVVAATGAVRSTATKGTVRMLVGLAAGLATWIVAGAVAADGFAAVVAGTLVAVEGAVALAVWVPVRRQAETLWGRLRVRDRVGLLPPALAARQAVADAVAVAASEAAAVPVLAG